VRKFHALLILWFIDPLKGWLPGLWSFLLKARTQYVLAIMGSIGFSYCLYLYSKKEVKKFGKWMNIGIGMIFLLILLAIVDFILSINERTRLVEHLIKLFAAMTAHLYRFLYPKVVDASQSLITAEQAEKLTTPKYTSFKAFILFCTLSTLISAGLLKWYKREVLKTLIGGDDPVIDVFISMYDTINSNIPNPLKLIELN
jgi:hypothetical protein